MAPVFWNRVHNDRTRLVKVVDFVTNQKRVWDCLLVINSNLSPMLPHFRHIRAFVRRKPLFPYPIPILVKIFTCSLMNIRVVVISERRKPSLIRHEIIFEVFQLMSKRYLNVTDRRTDGRTDGHVGLTTSRSNTALCVASRGKKHYNPNRRPLKSSGMFQMF